jgi:nitrite reductase/ring-hydroxylating ferredoxin subunit/NTP pyrophosphatase (non-canonical NTP hydrolase)
MSVSPPVRFVGVCDVGELPEGAARTVEANGRTIAVFNCGGQLYAIDDLCPHMGASLAAGHVEGCVVTCPWHAWRFDVRDGSWCDNPRIRTDVFPVRVSDGQIEVGLPEPRPSSRRTDLMPASPPATVAGQTDQPAELAAGPGLADFQQLIRRMYFEKDQARGVSGTFMWLMEEIGELATALRSDDRENLAEEFADVLAWLATIANVAEIDLAAAVAKKYGTGCPGCRRLVCVCPDAEKP